MISVIFCKWCTSFISRNLLQLPSSCYWPFHWCTQSFSLIHLWKFQSVLQQVVCWSSKICCIAAASDGFNLWTHLTAKYQMFRDLQGLTKLLWKIHWSQHKIFLPTTTRMMIKLESLYLLVKNKLLSLAKIWKQFIKLAATKMCLIKYSDLQLNRLFKYFFLSDCLLSCAESQGKQTGSKLPVNKVYVVGSVRVENESDEKLTCGFPNATAPACCISN